MSHPRAPRKSSSGCRRCGTSCKPSVEGESVMSWSLPDAPVAVRELARWADTAPKGHAAAYVLPGW